MMGAMGAEAAGGLLAPAGMLPVVRRLAEEPLPGFGAAAAPELVLGSLPDACLLTVGSALALLVLLVPRAGAAGLGAGARPMVELSCLLLAGLAGSGWLWPSCAELELLLRCSLATEEGWKGSRPVAQEAMGHADIAGLSCPAPAACTQQPTAMHVGMPVQRPLLRGCALLLHQNALMTGSTSSRTLSNTSCFTSAAAYQHCSQLAPPVGSKMAAPSRVWDCR